MDGKTVAIVIVLLLVAVIFLWWLSDVIRRGENVSNGNKTYDSQSCSASFSDMVDDFNTINECIWMTSNPRTLNDLLKNSMYHYVVIESDGKIFYDNRQNCGKHDECDNIDYMRLFETIMAVSIGCGFLVRDHMREVAIRVNNNMPKYRVVHISSPNLLK